MHSLLSCAVHFEAFPLQMNNKMGSRTGRISIDVLLFPVFFFFFLIGGFPLSKGLHILTTQVKPLGPGHVPPGSLCCCQVGSFCSVREQLFLGPP